MNRWILNSIGVSIIAALSLTVWGGFGLCRHLITVLDSWRSASTLGKLNAALDTINRPCGAGHPCGSLANADKAMVKVGDILVTSQLQEKDVAKAAESNMAAMNDLTGHLNKTADALTGTALGASVALGTANESIAAAKPLLTNLAATSASFTGLSDSLNARISDPAIDKIIGHLDTTSGHLDAVSGDLQKIADKTTGDILKPKPWWMKVGPYANDAVLAACLFSGRCG